MHPAAKASQTAGRLDRDLSDNIPSSDYKLVPLAEWEAMFADASPHFVSTPNTHQYASIAWALDKDRVVFWHDVGIGKTLTALYTAILWGCKRIFVVCPNGVRFSWQEEVKKHCSGYDVVVFDGPTETRRGVLEDLVERLYREPDYRVITAINYESLSYLFGISKTTVMGKTMLKYKIPPAIGVMGFDCLILDELHHLRSHLTNQTLICWAMSAAVDKVIGLTGTPRDRSEEELWSEFFAVDRGKSLGNNYYRFMNTHFKKSRFKYYPKPGTTERILSLVEPVTMRYDRAECQDLPLILTKEIMCPMTAEQSKELIKLTSSARTIGEMRGQGPKLLMACGGICASLSDEDNIVFLKNAAGGYPSYKLDALVEIVDELAGKILVFHQFVAEGRLIGRILETLGYPVVELRGETRKKQEALDRFVEDPDVRCLVAHPRCASEGINIQHVTNNIVWYSRDWSAIVQSQGVGRIWRTGQERECLVLDLIVKDSPDEAAYRAIQNKADANQAILDWMTNA